VFATEGEAVAGAAAEAFTGVKASDWKVSQHRVFPERL
jgi:hypothetical protein